jgi:hypothetical protein
MNLNQEIFTRKGAEKKTAIINAATEEDLMRVSKDTIIRIIKEIGSKVYLGMGKYSSRDKSLYIPNDRWASNRWNAWVKGIDYRKGKLFVNIYVQYSNTDTNTSDDYEDFFKRGNYRGEIRRLDRFGNGRTYFFCYDESDKARVMKSILLEFL